MRRDGEDFLPERKPSDRRFGPELRLRRRKDFARVFSGGVRLNVEVVTVVVRPNEVHHPRLGLAIPRRVARRAVVRHRLKRQIRESFRHNTERLQGLDVVVLARPGAEKMSSTCLRGLMARAWDRAHALARRTQTVPPATEAQHGN